MTTTALAAVLTLAGCNLFQTRDPEAPSQVSSNFVPPVVDSLVFDNMMNAFRDLNGFNYARSFADPGTSAYTFQFEPTPAAQNRYGIFSAWTRQSEQQYFERIVQSLPQGSVMSLELVLSRQSIQPDSAQYEAVYRLSIPHTQTDIPNEARGRAQFFLVVDRSGLWTIRQWVDFAVSPDDFTWSDVKGTFAQ